MSRRSENVKRWRKNTKAKMIKCMGGKCQICGYNKSERALCFHHLNEEEKEFGFGAIIANATSWQKIASELKKCVLLCGNCHMEVHDKLAVLPSNYQSFQETPEIGVEPINT